MTNASLPAGTPRVSHYVVANPKGLPLPCTKAGNEQESWRRFMEAFALNPPAAERLGYSLLEYS